MLEVSCHPDLKGAYALSLYVQGMLPPSQRSVNHYNIRK
jgi:hypothetical protein